jgi:hypothetical protein
MKSRPFLFKRDNSLKTFALSALCIGVPVIGNCAFYTIPFDTDSASGWTVTGGGAVGATPYVVNNPRLSTLNTYCLSLTSDSYSSGSFVTGGSLANFDGFWTATYTFSLPANATGVSFNYSNFFVDDRGVLTLNGNILNATGVPWSGFSGSMEFTDGGPLQPYSGFSTSENGFVSGTATSGFILGGVNTIRVIVNNTHSGIYGPLVNISTQDATSVGLSGVISYSVVPEPSLAALAMLGAMLLRVRRSGSHKG